MPNELTFSPGVDLITDKVAVVMQDRPVIGMSAWLSDALTSARSAPVAAGSRLARVSRVSPLRTICAAPSSRGVSAAGD